MNKVSIRGMVLLPLFVYGCGVGTQDLELPPERQVGHVEGVLFDGQYTKAHVAVFSIEDGKKGEFLGEADATEEGAFSVAVRSQPLPLLVEVTGGEYVESASGKLITVSENQRTFSVAPYQSGKTVRITVSPLTNIATGLLLHRLDEATEPARVFAETASDLEELFGFDVFTGIAASDNTAGEAALSHDGLILRALSNWTKELAAEENLEPHNVYHVAGLNQLLYNDANSDGILDGRGHDNNGEMVALQYGRASLNADFYRLTLAQQLLKTLSSGMDGEQQQLLTNYVTELANARSRLFSSEAIPFTQAAPTIELLSPTAAFHNETISVYIGIGGNAIVKDIEFSLDQNALGKAEDIGKPQLDIDTTLYQDGEHTLEVTAVDINENRSSRVFSLNFDNTEPFVNVVPTILTNNEHLILTGTYEENGAGIGEIRVQNRIATIIDNTRWQSQLDLNAGVNEIEILLLDDLGNQRNAKTVVTLDQVQPVLHSGNTHSAARFSLGNGDYQTDSLRDQNASLPLYIATDRLDLDGLQIDTETLTNNQIPYFNFKAQDPVFNGIATSIDKLTVEYEYAISDSTRAPWRRLAPVNDEFIIPLATETLHESWRTASPSDKHALTISVTDEAGNNTTGTFGFMTEFVVPLPGVTLGDYNNADFGQLEFAERETLSAKSYDMVEYAIENKSARAMLLRPSDKAVHVFNRTYETLQRKHKVRRVNTTQWQFRFVDNVLEECPTYPSAWFARDTIYNFASGAWHRRSAPISYEEPEWVDTDTPIAPSPEPWQNAEDFDTTFKHQLPSDNIDKIEYDYDYVAGLSQVERLQPALVRNWTRSFNGEDSTCSDSSMFQQRTVYSYESLEETPRNDIAETGATQNFTTAGFLLLAENDQEITPNGNWYRIPARATVRLRKIVQLPAFVSKNQTELLTPDSVTDYEPREMDKDFEWQIDTALSLQLVHDGEWEVIPESSILSQDYEFAPKPYRLARPD